MELFERYVHEVGKDLPRALRADVEAELRSLLQDQLEARAAETGRPADEALAAEVLKAMGRPDRVASRYLPQRWLIGPALYPTYVAVVRGVLAFVAMWFVFWLVVGSRTPAGPLPDPLHWRGWAEAMDDFLRFALINLAIITLVFAGLERFGHRGEAPRKSREWDPRQLPKIDDRERISRARIVWRLYFILATTFLVNVLPAGVAAIAEIDGTLFRIPLLLDTIRVHLVALNLWWAAALALNLVLFARGRWDRGTRLAELVVGVAAIFLLVRLASGPAFIGIPREWVADQDLAAGQARVIEAIQHYLWRVVRFALWICVFLALCENAVRAWRWLRGESGRPAPGLSPDGARAAAP